MNEWRRLPVEDHSLDCNGPVIIGGEHRSGTTLLSLILNAHPNIAVGPEIDFLLPGNLGPEILECCALLRADDPRVQGEGVQTADPSYHLGVQFVRQCHRFGVGLFKLTALVRDAMERRGSELAALDDRIFLMGQIGAHCAMEAGKPRWGFKVQRDLTLAEAFLRHWPDARFLHIVRDGRDVAASQLRSGFTWAPRSVEEIAANWVAMLDGMEAVPCEVIQLKYEDLVLDLEQTSRLLLGRLGLPWSDEVLRHSTVAHTLLENPYDHPSAEAVARPVTAGAINRHCSDLTDGERKAFQTIAGAWLERLGYD